MKKLVVLLIVLSLFGCNKSIDDELSSLGYSDNDIECIKSFNSEIQDKFLSEYNEDYIDLIHVYGFDPNKFDEYLKYKDKYDLDELVSLVNSGEISKYEELFSNEYYLAKNKDIYLDNLDKYDSVRDCIEAVNTKRYLDYYEDIKSSDTSKDCLMLINKYYGLPSDYEPDNLVEIEPNYGRSIYVRQDVYEAYKKMQDDANELGYYFTITSAYRSYDYQEGLYNKYLEEDEGGVEAVDTYSARPGHSEHQSGLCLDLSDAEYGMDDFGYSESSKWVNENCYKYGFIIRYTQEKENITGYQAEPWQVRYVGSSEIAKDIMDRNITFDEYYACFVE